jgi:LacI family transcriptional regulator
MTDDIKSNNTDSYPTIRDVARRAGVSQASISRALHGAKGVSEETKARIISIAREMGYDPYHNTEARRLISRRYGKNVLYHIIGLFFHHPGFSQSNYFIRILQGVFDAVSGTPFEILTSDTSRLHSGLMEIPVAYRRGEVDGALTFAPELTWAPVVEELRSIDSFGDRPIVELMEHAPGCSGVFPDTAGSGHAAMSHLIELGHRRVLSFVYGTIGKTDAFSLRLAGMYQACQEAGLDPEKTIVPTIWPEFPPVPREEWLQAILDRNPSITAILARQDQMAVDIYGLLTQAGMRVPEDMSLVGFDDSDPILDSNGSNILTTVRVPLHELGRRGAELLMDRILGKEKENRDVLLPTELIVRGTTAPPSR